jgi:hypothetical protein
MVPHGIRGALAASLLAACSAPDRTFGGGGGSTTSGDPSGTTGEGGGPSSSGSGSPQGSGAGSSGSGPSQTSTGSGGSTGSGPGCGNGVVENDEECDEPTGLCEDCVLSCPSGWLRSGSSCFGVAIGDVGQYDGFEAQSKCGALAVAATGHRAHAATPSTPEDFTTLAGACAQSGCWIGFLGLGEPATTGFFAPTTDEEVPVDAPWAAGEPTRDVAEACLRLTNEGDIEDVVPALATDDCAATAYFACELEIAWGSLASCGNDQRDEHEECDGDAGCVGCDRVGPGGWVEDPRTHACYEIDGTESSWDDAEGTCEGQAVGVARLATPDEAEDVRVLQILASGATLWIGVDVIAGSPTWISGEAYGFVNGSYPTPGAAPTDGQVGTIDVAGVVFQDRAGPRAPMCELFDL